MTSASLSERDSISPRVTESIGGSFGVADGNVSALIVVVDDSELRYLASFGGKHSNL